MRINLRIDDIPLECKNDKGTIRSQSKLADGVSKVTVIVSCGSFYGPRVTVKLEGDKPEIYEDFLNNDPARSKNKIRGEISWGRYLVQFSDSKALVKFQDEVLSQVHWVKITLPLDDMPQAEFIINGGEASKSRGGMKVENENTDIDKLNLLVEVVMSKVEGKEYREVTVRAPKDSKIWRDIKKGYYLDFSIDSEDKISDDPIAIKTWLKPGWAFQLTPQLKKVLEEAKELAQKEFIKWLKEKHEMSDYASKRQELMMECTHPARQSTGGNSNNPDVLWHCQACGFVRYKEG